MNKTLLTVSLNEGGGYDVWAYPSLPLVELSAGLTQVYATLLCKGAFRFTIQRQPHREALHLTVTPHARPRPIEFPHYAPLSALVSEGLIPAYFKDDDLWAPADSQIAALPGHQRMGGTRQVLLGNPASGGGLLLNYQQPNPHLTVAEHGYYIGDTTVPLFWRGASTHRVQISRAILQHRFDTYVHPKDQPALFTDPSVPAYPPGGTVAAILSNRN